MLPPHPFLRVLRVRPDNSPFLHFTFGFLSCSVCVYNSIPYVQNRAELSSDVRIFKIYHAKILTKLNFLFRKTLSLRIWKTSLTQNWIHSTIFEILSISFSKYTYATSNYLFWYRSRMLTVTISLAIGDLTSFAKVYVPLRD